MLLREVWRGRLWTARPVIVVADAPDRLALYVPAGVHWLRPVDRDGRPVRLPEWWVLADRVWHNRALFLIQPGAAHAVVLFWADDDGRFLSWYVNLQEPIRRIRQGFEYMDQALDIVVSPDLSQWRWKDRGELDEAVAAGIFSAETAQAVVAEGARVVRRIEQRLAPFGEGWERWRPDPRWSLPRLKEGWDSTEQPV